MSHVGYAFASLRQHNYESEKPEHSRGIQVSLILNYAGVAECTLTYSMGLKAT